MHVPLVQPFITFGAKVIVGRLEFAALAGVTSGTMTRRPESARIASIVPELNFVRYAFVGVFNIFSLARPGCLYK